MRTTLALLTLGLLAPMVQGAAAAYLPVRFLPDLSLLLVIALGLVWRSTAGGLVLAALLGFAADLLSGSLLGQHALLRVAAFGAARFGSRHLNLRGALPQAVFVFFFTIANALALALLTTFFVGVGGTSFALWSALASHAVVNALCAPLVAAGLAALVRSLGSDDGGRRIVRLEPRGRTA